MGTCFVAVNSVFIACYKATKCTFWLLHAGYSPYQPVLDSRNPPDSSLMN